MIVGTHFPWSGPLATPDRLRLIAKALDEGGFDHVNIGEHLLYPKVKQTHHPHRPQKDGKYGIDPSQNNLEMLTLFAWIGGQTTRLRFNSYVLIIAYRSPFAVAKQVATLDYLTGGRVTLGVGIGWLKEEFDILKIPFEERGARTDEAVALLKALFEDRPFEGRFWSVPEVWFEPKPVQKPTPIWLGGNNEHALARLVRYGDGWTPLMSVEELAQSTPTMRRMMEAAGRDPDRIEVMGTVRAVGRPTKDQILADARAWRAAGATGVNLHMDQLEGYTEVEPFLDLIAWLSAQVLPDLRAI